ncbi:hypothetical protein CERZMDRAFT_101362 [Cercospora zeae-maydis SCOH1-5]|uniref:Uncharacterized protein n=1 Tax=Cercospora zeae-maydis SCOH1-5 TaxID=717836 RepID=A0A6A6F5N1_9PEZI|nr:hypothetical protein CERZMDRAFT_101362 [Cercospora zeae-maydis SCOH1-5]
MGRMSIVAFFWLFATTAIVTLVAGHTPRVLAWPLGLWIDLTVAYWVLGPIYRYIWPVLRSKIQEGRKRRHDSIQASTFEPCDLAGESKTRHEENISSIGVTNGHRAILQADCPT